MLYETRGSKLNSTRINSNCLPLQNLSVYIIIIIAYYYMAMAMAIHFTKDRFTSFFTKQKPTKALGGGEGDGGPDLTGQTKSRGLLQGQERGAETSRSSGLVIFVLF